MRLERVEIFGFKSFPHKVQLQFDQGITAFVGPNGCGKTNIVDAVKWALGEQNAHLLRCDRMEDLIFNGTKSRKPLGLAEVTLTLLNDGDLPLGFREVAVARRLYRSGESEYLVNRRPSRLREILDVFMDTGLGQGAYSFFEQKMIDQILSSEPASRRAFFEEAAGIAKYRSRKKDSLRKLEVTEGDLLRLDDLLGEIEKGVRSLRRQRGRAERYLRLKEELREAEIALVSSKVEELEEAGARLRESISSAQTERAKKMEVLASLEKKLSGDRSYLNEEEERSRRRAAELEGLGARIQMISEEILVSKERGRFLGEDETRLKDELEEIQGTLPSVEEALKEARKEALARERRARALREKRSTGLEGLKREEEVVVDKRLSMEEQEEGLNALATRAEELGRDILSVQVRLEGNRERAIFLEREVAELGSKTEMVRARLAPLKEQLVGLVESLKGEESSGQALGDELEARKKASDKLSQEFQELERNLHRMSSEFEILSSHQERLEGYTQAARHIVEKEGVRVIDDLIDFAPEYERAVEGVLSHRSQAAIVSSGEDAVRLLSLVRGKGQVTLLPLDLVLPGLRSKPPSRPEVLGVLSDFVNCEDGFSPILDALIGGYLLVVDLETALRLSKEEAFSRWGLVTPQGDVVEPSRAVTGGHSRVGLLGRRRRLRDLEEEIARLGPEVEEKRRKKEALALETARLTAEVQEFKRLVKERVEAKVETELKLSRVEFEEEGIVSSVSQLKKEMILVKQAIEADEGELVSRTSELTRLEEERGKRREELEGLRANLAGSEDELDRVSREIELSQMELLRDEEQLENLQKEVRRGEERIEELESIKSRKGEERLNLEREIESLKGNLEEREIALKELYGSKEKLLEERTLADRKRKGVSADVKELEVEIERLRKTLGSSEEPMQKLRMDLLELEMEQKTLRERVKREFNVDLDVVSRKEVPREEAQKSIERLRESLVRLEPVNLLASQELKDAEERLDFLRSQKLDLIEAKETLKKTLESMDRHAKRQFLETFEQIRKNFKEVFFRLFGEGEADLFLSRESAPLEAEIGVVARPPGKRLQRIELLSAGERSLVAIALLFAIYLTKPSPFCILDELDAALDDANLDRFISLLRELSQKSQLVLVTHNRRTMEVADYLYGVTMAEPGVTSIVSVKMAGDQ